MMLEYLLWIWFCGEYDAKNLSYVIDFFGYTCTAISYLFNEYVYAIIHMLVGGIVKYS